MRRVITVLVLALLVAACGGSGDDATGTTGSGRGDATIPATIPADPDRTAAIGDLVSVDYTGTLDDGSQFDTSIGRAPLQFEIGAGRVIDGFDAAVQGLKVGETVTVRLTPDEAYGEYQETLVQEVPLDNLPDGVAAGDELVSQQGQTVVVLDVGTDAATIDFNHPLAGQSLTFEITLVSFDS